MSALTISVRNRRERLRHPWASPPLPQDVFVDLHQHRVVPLRSVLGFVLGAGRAAHRGHLLGVSPRPLDLGCQVLGIAWGEMQSGAPIRDDFLHYSNPRGEDRNATRERFRGDASKGLVITLRR